MSDNMLFKYLSSSSASLGAALTALGTSFRLLATDKAFEKTFVTHQLGDDPTEQFMFNCPLTTHVAYQLISFLLGELFKSAWTSCGCLRLLFSSGLSHYDMSRENIIQDNLLDAELNLLLS